MRILIVNTYYYPHNVGGTEESIMLLAETLANIGHIVYVYSIDGSGRDNHRNEGISFEKINGVNVYRDFKNAVYDRYIIKKQNIINHIICVSSFFINRHSNKTLRRIIDSVKPDIIHTNGLRCISTWIWKYSSRYHIPLVHTLRDYILLNYRSTVVKKRTDLYELYMKYQSNKYLNRVTATSSFILTAHTKKGFFKDSDCTVIENAVKIDYGYLDKLIKEKLNRRDKWVIFVYAGQLYPHKGVKNLIEAFKMIDNDGVRLDIYGAGSMEDYVVQNANEDSRINYLGWVPHEELYDALAKSDVVVVPSIWEEPFGRVIIEAALNGCAVIASDKGGMKEIIKTINHGEWYAADSIEDLRDKILKFCNRDLVNRYIEIVPNNIRYYDSIVQANRFIELYKNTISKTKSSEDKGTII